MAVAPDDGDEEMGRTELQACLTIETLNDTSGQMLSIS